MSTVQEPDAATEQSAPPISTVAGSGVAGFAGDNEPAVSAQLNHPYGIAVDGAGTLYFSDRNNHRVRKITTDGKISTVAGTGVAGHGGDNGSAVSAQLHFPRGLLLDGAGTLYIADSGNHRIRKITADGKISTVAGTGVKGFRGDGAAATAAHLNWPYAMTLDSSGVLWFSDCVNHRVRKITADGKISTVAGTGTAGFKGDGAAATAAHLNHPSDLVVDSAGNLYIAEITNHRVRKITADGTISTVAGTGTAGFKGDGAAATAAHLNKPIGLLLDSAGCLYIADSVNHRVRKIAADGTISTVAGTGTAGSGGDGGPAASAQLNSPTGLAVDCVENLYIGDLLNHRIRRIPSARMAGLPESGTVVSWANVRSKLRMGVLRESTKDGAEIHQALPAPRDHQRWRLVVAGQDDGDVLYRIENVRSGRVLEVVDAQERAGAVVAQRAYEGGEARHQQWRLIPVGSASGSQRLYEIANRNSGLLLRVDTNARGAIKQHGAEGDHQGRQWELLPV
ncbi:RICIN domain-containing protein [Streptomyces niveus]|uniref:NHL domain-containing protein n=1 Tax=Streptomyces niveus TaxID=193462 RepID=UPI0038389AD1